MSSKKSISATLLANLSSKQQGPSVFSFLKTEQPVNLDLAFPESKKSYTYEIRKQISLYMKDNNIVYAQITTASNLRPCVRIIVNLRKIKKGKPELNEVVKGHPDISQHLYSDIYVLNPGFLTA